MYFCVQVHGHHRIAGDVRQHSRAGEQAATAVPPASQSHAGHRGRDEGLDRRVPTPV